ncbi:MAG: DUF3618 domain-containing protein [Zhengella sp.]|uniref:DUF3618 domain-containing protein n=1 Tax=Zhengella sp. TaxID=2282762 RepID=UPI001D5F9EBC|nr:DUF3618 domain-containing protein [Notoacmeibacter sp.]
MSNDHRTPDEIERDVERQRSELTDAIEELRSRFSPDAVFREVTRSLGEHGGDMGRAVGHSVKQNPVALALTGVGLAWLIFGRSHDDDDDDGRSVRMSRGNGGSGEWGPARRQTPQPPLGARSYGAHAAPRHQGGYPAWVETGDRFRDPDEDDGHQGRSLGEKASDAASSARESVSHASHSAASAARRAGETASQAAGSARHGIEEARHAAARRAARARDQLSHGTEQLGESARERVIAARERAMAARYQAGRTMRRSWRQGRDTAVDFFEDQPLVAGALALAAGAAIASAIPRSRVEDDLIGEESDHLIDEAERIFDEERHKAAKVGQAALKEAGAAAGEIGSKADSAATAAVKTASDEARDAASRVRSAAGEEAARQNLGKPDA